MQRGALDDNDASLGRSSLTAAFLMRQLGALCSFETTLVLFLFAGIYKEDPRFSWIPGDLTILAFGLSFVTGMYIIVRRGIVLRRQAIMLTGMALLFVVWALLSFLWTPSLSYSIRKVGLLGSLTLWPLAAFALIVSNDRVRVRRFFVVLMVFSVWIAIESSVAFLFAAQQGIRGFIKTSLSTSYQGLARVIGPGMLVLVTYQVYFLRRGWQRFAGAGLIALYAFLMLGLGSRGPFLAMALSALLIVAVNLRAGRNIRQLTGQVLAVMAVLTFIAGVVFFFTTSGVKVPRTIQRLQKVQEEGITGNTRFESYEATWQLLDEAPLFGRGIGSWPVVAGKGDIRSYPHNIFLEIFFELGLVGLLLFAGLLIYAMSLVPGVRVLRREPWMLLALAQLLSAFVNANISGDMNDNKLFWAFLGLAAVCALRPQSVTSEPEPQDRLPGHYSAEHLRIESH